MSMENAERYVADMKENGGGLAAGIEARIDKSAPKEEQLAAFLAAAKDEGYEFTVEELREAVTAASGEPAGELSDEELAAVAGGGDELCGKMVAMIRAIPSGVEPAGWA